VARRAVALLALALLAPLAALRAGAEAIRSFEAELFVEPGGAFTVDEHIVYDFGAAARHGIFREIPLRGGDGFGESRSIAIDVEGVTDGSHSPQPWRRERDGSRLRIRIGDPDRTVTGVHEYRIRYRVRRALRFRREADELAWNVTGDEWKVPIGRAAARVFLPPGADAAAASARCFSGPHGSRASDCVTRAEGGSVVFETGALGPAAGLTAVVELRKGVLQEPSAAQRAFEALRDAGGAWLAAPLAVLALFTWLWRRRGVDEGAQASVPVRYEPPEGLTPAEVGTVLDERADLSDLTATLLDLAVRGYLEIQEVDSPRFLDFGRRDFVLHQRRPADDGLKPHERALHEALFDGRDSVRISSLRQKFSSQIQRVKALLYEGLSGRGGCFPTSPERVRRGTYLLAGGFLFAAFLAFQPAAPPLAPWSLVGCAGIVALFAPAMPRRTRRGRRLYEEILGFREFLQRVDRDRLDRFGGRTTDRFERVLPFAIVLGAADAWADVFADLYQKAPDWYRSSRSGSFHADHFVSDLGRSLHTIGRTLSESPPSSGSGGGGGGFSGGGFGGGGGGSW
jgi:hypothetical protein